VVVPIANWTLQCLVEIVRQNAAPGQILLSTAALLNYEI